MAKSALWDTEGPGRGGHFLCASMSLLLLPSPGSFTTSFPSTFLESISKINFTQCRTNAGRPALNFQTDLGWHPRAYLGAKHPFGGRISVPEAVSFFLIRNPASFSSVPLWVKLPPNPKFLLCKDELRSHFFSVVARAHFSYCSSVD